MKCPACGNENQPGAKFCVHCGIVLGTASAPAWTAAPAGSASAPPPRPAAPVQPTPTPAPSVARPAAAAGPAPAAPAAVLAAAVPESTPKAWLMIAVAALLIVLGAGGYFGYRMLSGEGKETVAEVEPLKPAEAPPPPPPVAPATDTPATQDAPPTAAPTASPPTAASAPVTGVERSRTVAPAPTGVPLPGRPPTAVEGTKTDSGQMKAAPSKAPPKGAPPGAEAPPKVAPPPKAAPPPVAPSPAPSKALAKGPAPAPAPDRWQVMKEAMAQCAPAPFFSRIACEQRTRNRYCEGYWGQVAQCPSAPTKDHGQ